MIAAVLIGGTALFSFLLLPINQIFESYNGFVADGMVTQQNYDAMNFQHNVILITPLIILFGVMCWGIIRALEKKWEGVQ